MTHLAEREAELARTADQREPVERRRVVAALAALARRLWQEADRLVVPQRRGSKTRHTRDVRNRETGHAEIVLDLKST